MGDLDRPCLKAKGMESRHFLGYIVYLLDKHADEFGFTFKLLRGAGHALQDYYAILSEEHRRLPQATHIDLMKHCVNHNVLFKSAGGPMVPKSHSFVNMTQDACLSGNPAYTSTAQDESDNGLCKAIAERAHGLTWIVSTFERLEILEMLEVDLHACT